MRRPTPGTTQANADPPASCRAIQPSCRPRSVIRRIPVRQGTCMVANRTAARTARLPVRRHWPGLPLRDPELADRDRLVRSLTGGSRSERDAGAATGCRVTHRPAPCAGQGSSAVSRRWSMRGPRMRQRSPPIIQCADEPRVCARAPDSGSQVQTGRRFALAFARLRILRRLR